MIFEWTAQGRQIHISPSCKLDDMNVGGIRPDKVTLTAGDAAEIWALPNPEQQLRIILAKLQAIPRKRDRLYSHD